MESKKDRKYRLWREGVIRLLLREGHIKDALKVSPDIYKVYFEDGYIPSNAIKEDMGIDAIKKGIAII